MGVGFEAINIILMYILGILKNNKHCAQQFLTNNESFPQNYILYIFKYFIWYFITVIDNANIR